MNRSTPPSGLGIDNGPADHSLKVQVHMGMRARSEAKGKPRQTSRSLRDRMAGDGREPGGAERVLRGLDRPGTHERKPPKTIVLDMYSSESPIYGEQEGSAIALDS